MSWAGSGESSLKTDLSPCSAVGKNIWIHWYHGHVCFASHSLYCICLGVSEIFLKNAESLQLHESDWSFFWKMVGSEKGSGSENRLLTKHAVSIVVPAFSSSVISVCISMEMCGNITLHKGIWIISTSG